MHGLNTVEKFIEMRAKNNTLEKIATELNVSKRTLNYWNIKYYRNILIQKQFEIDEIKEKLNISDSQNLEFYAQVIEKCKEAFLNIHYVGTMKIDLVRIFNMAVNKVNKCNIINSKNAGNFFQSKDEFFDNEMNEN